MDISFKIVDGIAVLSESSKGWTKELNMVSWNGRDAKLDIRDWDEKHEKMGKGVTLTRDEAFELYLALSKMFGKNTSAIDVTRLVDCGD